VVLVGVNEPNSVSDKTVEALANDNSVVVLLKQLLTIILPLSITLTPITPFTDEDFKDFARMF
jgi:2-succinyl-5-enolpyruvyl-6-hydroxy-3-cyclohexene-1-carboxylate synthase